MENLSHHLAPITVQRSSTFGAFCDIPTSAGVSGKQPGLVKARNKMAFRFHFMVAPHKKVQQMSAGLSGKGTPHSQRPVISSCSTLLCLISVKFGSVCLCVRALSPFVVLFLQLTLKRRRRKSGFHFLNAGRTSLRSPPIH